MPDGFEEVGIAVGLIISIVVVFFWLLPVELLPILSEMSGSEIISPIFSYMVGVLLTLVVILFFVKGKISCKIHII
ncbi:hypothetical protein C5S30_05210 [ANME-1 cluster archaeon GoMg4]|nr:hypothetical protein [ANME-1 cluster archaeon GoMg4]